MTDEPRRHPRFMLVLGLVVLCTAPFPFIGNEYATWWGLPRWLWWSGAFTVALSLLTAYGILRLWSGDDVE